MTLAYHDMSHIQTPQHRVPMLQWLPTVLGGQMHLFLFRLSLKERSQRDVFERKDEKGADFDREAWLRSVFSRQFTFSHRTVDVFFVPEDASKIGLPDKIIVGWLARDKTLAERTAPWEGLDPTEHMSWQAALLLIDPSHHDDGQKVALEYRTDVAKPLPLLASLAAHFENGEPVEPFSVNVFPIVQERSFSRFASQNVGSITTITYDVAVPNMFSSPNDFTDELKALRDKGNVSTVKSTLKSDGAIDTTASRLDEIASHAEKGGGKITAKTKDGKKYNSDDHMVKEEIDTENLEPETPSFWSKIAGALDRIF